MQTNNLKRYQSPKTSIYSLISNEVCIGFGEGSIPPEDSDSNLGWFEEDSFVDDNQTPNMTSKLWDE